MPVDRQRAVAEDASIVLAPELVPGRVGIVQDGEALGPGDATELPVDASVRLDPVDRIEMPEGHDVTGPVRLARVDVERVEASVHGLKRSAAPGRRCD